MMSQCEAYVKWVRGKSDQWATWEPGERVSAGDIGTFSRNLQFQSSLSVTLNDLGVVPTVGKAYQGISRYYYESRYISATGSTAALVGGLTAIGGIEPTLSIKASKSRKHVLYMNGGTVYRVENVEAALLTIREALVRGQWNLDWVLVGEHVQAMNGFAAISHDRRAMLSFKASGRVPLHPDANELADIDLDLRACLRSWSAWLVDLVGRGGQGVVDGACAAVSVGSV